MNPFRFPVSSEYYWSDRSYKQYHVQFAVGVIRHRLALHAGENQIVDSRHAVQNLQRSRRQWDAELFAVFHLVAGNRPDGLFQIDVAPFHESDVCRPDGGQDQELQRFG